MKIQVKEYFKQDKNDHEWHGGVELHDKYAASYNGNMHGNYPLIRLVHQLLHGACFILFAKNIIFYKRNAVAYK